MYIVYSVGNYVYCILCWEVYSGVAKVSGAPVQRYVPEHLAPLVQIGVVNSKKVRCIHLDKFGFGNGISRMLTSLIDKMYI